MLLGCLFLSLYSVFSLGPGLHSPLSSHWADGGGGAGAGAGASADACAAMAGAAIALALAYQTYLSVVVFKVQTSGETDTTQPTTHS